MRILFLYTELAGYFLKCCEELSASWEVHIVRWPVNPEAPFSFEFPAQIRVRDKNSFTDAELKQHVKTLAPDMIVCSGWVDRDYLRITKEYYGKIPTVVTCDTHWRGSLKQYVATVLSRFFLLSTFTYAWVPGEIQAKYARKLGFREQNIRRGFYVCDLKTFNSVYEKHAPAKRENFPKRFLYVGRYYNFKGITDLWDAFESLHDEGMCDWELWCLGTGTAPPREHRAIRHFGFVQPGELDPYLAATGVFVLPSREEPWGVVAHEYAAAGFPLILSTAVGASEAFLAEGENGYGFKAGDISDLKAAFKKIMKLSPKELNLMAERSHQLAQKIHPAQWADTVKNMYYDFRQN